MDFNHDTGQITSVLTIDTTVAPPLGGLSSSLAITGTGCLVVPMGTAAERPGTPSPAMLRYNTDSSGLEFYNGATWGTISSGGTVSSVALTVPSFLSVVGSPITTAGTLAVSLATQANNLVFAGPTTGGPLAPTFRLLATSDIPSLSAIYLPLTGGTVTGTITMSGATITGIPTPTAASDAANKAYVDSVAQGADPKGSVRAATTVTGSLATAYANGSTIDGVTLTTGDRILIKNQAAPAENGIYTVNASGSPTRDLTMDTWLEVPGSFVWVEQGTTLADTGWVCTSDQGGTLDTTAITWMQFGGIGSYTVTSPISLTGNVISLSGLSGFGTSNQIIGMNNAGTALEYKTVTAGTAISVVQATNAITINNTGVTAFAIATAAQTSALVLSGATGSLTLTIDTDLNAIAALTTTGVIVRTAAGTAATRTNTGTTNQITITDGDGVAGNPTFAIANNPVFPGTSSTTITTGTTAQQPAAGIGQIRYDSTSNQLMWSNSTTWTQLSTGGTVTSVAVSGGTTGLTTSGGPITGTGTITLAGTLAVANGGTGITTAPANGALLIGNGTGYASATLTSGTGISVTNGAGSITINNTGVTSVALTVPSFLSVAGSPVTTTGTLAVSLATQANNLVFAGPTTGGPLAPTFRALAASDLSFIQLYRETASSPTTPVASGTNAVAIGSGSSATAATTFAVGDGSSATIVGQKAYANGRFATAGDAQSSVYILRNSTTNATSTDLFLDGTTTRLIMPNNSVWTFDILVAARRTDAVGGGASYRFVGGIRKDTTAGSTTLIGTPTKSILGETNAAWDVVLTADTTNGGIRLAVTGEAAKTIRWVAVVRTCEVTN